MKITTFLLSILISTLSFSQENTYTPSPLIDSNDVFLIVENPPQFVGGMTAMVEYFQTNIVYPKMEREVGISGTCFISFVVETDGSINDVKLIKGIPGGDACNNEALRVVREMPNWTPGTQDGKAVRVQFNIPIKFALNDFGKKKKKKRKK